MTNVDGEHWQRRSRVALMAIIASVLLVGCNRDSQDHATHRILSGAAAGVEWSLFQDGEDDDTACLSGTDFEGRECRYNFLRLSEDEPMVVIPFTAGDNRSYVVGAVVNPVHSVKVTTRLTTLDLPIAWIEDGSRGYFVTAVADGDIIRKVNALDADGKVVGTGSRAIPKR